MAPKAITRDRIVHAASQSAANLRAEVRAALVEHLGCDYLDEAGGPLRKTTELKFRWSFRGAGYEEAEECSRARASSNLKVSCGSSMALQFFTLIALLVDPASVESV